MAADKNDTSLADAIILLAASLKEQKEGTASAITAALKAARTDGSGLSPEKLAELEGVPVPKKWREIECVSQETGATFTATVVESKPFKNGRVTEMKNYRYPAGALLYMCNGGLVPDNLQILSAGTGAPQGDPNLIPKHDFTPYYLQWRYTELYKRDHFLHVGKELKPFFTREPGDFSKPWSEGRVRADLTEVV